MKVCRMCNEKISYKNQLKYYNYPGVQKICKPCKKSELKKHNDKKYKTIIVNNSEMAMLEAKAQKHFQELFSEIERYNNAQ